jgi:hypothetical protein
MKPALLYLSAPLVVAVLAPFAIIRAVAPYPAIFLVGTIPVVFFFTLLVAMPLYFAVPKASRVNALVMLGVAAITGALSYFAFNYVMRGWSAQVGQAILVQEGKFTPEGWRQLLSQSAWMGMLSLPGGFLFWLGEVAPLLRTKIQLR